MKSAVFHLDFPIEGREGEKRRGHSERFDPTGRGGKGLAKRAPLTPEELKSRMDEESGKFATVFILGIAIKHFSTELDEYIDEADNYPWIVVSIMAKKLNQMGMLTDFMNPADAAAVTMDEVESRLVQGKLYLEDYAVLNRWNIRDEYNPSIRSISRFWIHFRKNLEAVSEGMTWEKRAEVIAMITAFTKLLEQKDFWPPVPDRSF